LQFLRYAFASNGELKVGYYAASGRQYITGVETSELIELNESIAKMLRRWQGALKARPANKTDATNVSRSVTGPKDHEPGTD
jgi:hypothetical protein